MNVNSKISLITSNTAPSSSELGKGELAYGTVDGLARLYGNDGSGVVQLNSPEAEQMLYFSSQDELNEFLFSGDVPTGGWYATVADTVYEQYGEWVAFKLSPMITSTAGGTFDMSKISGSSNGDSFYGLLNEVDHGPDGVGSEIQFGNYAHSRYFLYLDYSADSTTNWTIDFNFENKASYSVDVRDMDKIGDNNPGHLEVTMDNYTADPQVAVEDNKNLYLTASGAGSYTLSGYLVIKEILSDGEPWINWDEYISTEPTPGPSNNYSSVNLSGTLANGVNNIKMSNFTSTGTLNSLKAIRLQDDYTIAVNGYGAGLTKLTVDASIPFFGMPDYNFPDMNIQLSNTIHGSHLWKIPAQYSQGSKMVKWQDELNIDLPPQADSGVQTMAQFDGDTYISVDVMQYMEGDAPNLTGTLKIEDA